MSKLVLNNRNEEHISFVLCSDVGDIIAVIVPKPDADCIGLVAKAILDDFTGTDQVKFNKIMVDNDEFITHVTLGVTLIDEDGDEYSTILDLTKSALYHD